MADIRHIAQSYKVYYAKVTMQEIVNSAAAALSGQQKKAMSAFAASIRHSIRSDPRMKQIHQRVGLRAQVATIAAYRRNVKGRSGDYRADEEGPYKRYAGGRLLGVLSSGDFFSASRAGLSIVNVNTLDDRAKQWYRLNFGAGARANSGARHRNYSLYFFGQAANVGLSFKQFQPSAAFRIPRGVFGQLQGQEFTVTPPGTGRGDQFMPGGFLRRNGITAVSNTGRIDTVGPQISRGIAATAFLDAVPRTLARELPFEYTRLLKDWIDQAAASYTGPIASVITPKTVARIAPAVNRQMDIYARQQRFRSRF